MHKQATIEKISIASIFPRAEIEFWENNRVQAINRLRITSKDVAIWAEEYFRANPDISIFEYAPRFLATICPNSEHTTEIDYESWIILYLASSLLDDVHDGVRDGVSTTTILTVLTALGTAGVSLSITGSKTVRQAVRSEIERALSGQILSITPKSSGICETDIAAQKNSLLNVAGYLSTEGSGQKFRERTVRIAGSLRLPFQVLDDLDDLLVDFHAGTRTTINHEGIVAKSRSEINSALVNLALSGQADKLLRIVIFELNSVIEELLDIGDIDSATKSFFDRILVSSTAVREQFVTVATVANEKTDRLEVELEELIRRTQVIAVGS